MDKEIARAGFLAACEKHREDLRKVLELYQSGKVGTREGNTPTTEAAIKEVLARIDDWDKFLKDK
jgi:hypothetical protein